MQPIKRGLLNSARDIKENISENSAKKYNKKIDFEVWYSRMEDRISNGSAGDTNIRLITLITEYRNISASDQPSREAKAIELTAYIYRHKIDNIKVKDAFSEFDPYNKLYESIFYPNKPSYTLSPTKQNTVTSKKKQPVTPVEAPPLVQVTDHITEAGPQVEVADQIAVEAVRQVDTDQAAEDAPPVEEVTEDCSFGEMSIVQAEIILDEATLILGEPLRIQYSIDGKPMQCIQDKGEPLKLRVITKDLFNLVGFRVWRHKGTETAYTLLAVKDQATAYNILSTLKPTFGICNLNQNGGVQLSFLDSSSQAKSISIEKLEDLKRFDSKNLILCLKSSALKKARATPVKLNLKAADSYFSLIPISQFTSAPLAWNYVPSTLANFGKLTQLQAATIFKEAALILRTNNVKIVYRNNGVRGQQVSDRHNPEASLTLSKPLYELAAFRAIDGIPKRVTIISPWNSSMITDFLGKHKPPHGFCYYDLKSNLIFIKNWSSKDDKLEKRVLLDQFKNLHPKFLILCITEEALTEFSNTGKRINLNPSSSNPDVYCVPVRQLVKVPPSEPPKFVTNPSHTSPFKIIMPVSEKVIAAYLNDKKPEFGICYLQNKLTIALWNNELLTAPIAALTDINADLELLCITQRGFEEFQKEGEKFVIDYDPAHPNPHFCVVKVKDLIAEKQI